MSEDTIATSTTELAGSYDSAPNVTTTIDADSMPWLLRDKFKGDTPEEQIRNQAMAYPELQSKMGKWWGAPKEGDYDISALKEYGIDEQDVIFAGMKDSFKEMGLSNEAIKKIAATYDDSLKKLGRKIEEDLQKSMTPEFASAAKRVEGYIQKFPKEKQEQMKAWLQTPEDFAAFNQLIAMNPTGATGSGMNLPSQGATYGQKFETSRIVEAEKIANHGKYKKDPAYRADVAQRMRDALIREGKG